MTNTNNKFCALIALNNVNINLKLQYTLEGVFQTLIINGYENFLLCENNSFDALCYNTLQNLKIKYPQIKKIKCTSHTKKVYDHLFLTNNFEQCDKKEYFCSLINKAEFVIFSSVNNKNKLFEFLTNFCKQNKKAYLIL